MGVANGRGYPEGCVASGWNLWVWLECIGVVSGCCCKEVQWNPLNWATSVPGHLPQLSGWPNNP